MSFYAARTPKLATSDVGEYRLGNSMRDSTMKSNDDTNNGTIVECVLCIVLVTV